MRVAIVGGGISGLSLAERLGAAGIEPVVLEAAPQVGGKIATRHRDGFLLETGPNGFLDKEPKTTELAERIGLRGALRPAGAESHKRWIWLRGGLREVATKPPAFLGSDLLPWATKLRLAGELFTRRAPAGKDETVAEFGRRHLGRRATRDLLSAMVLGIYGGDAERLSLQSAFPRMAELDRDHRSLILAMIRLQKQKKAAAGGPAGPSGILTSCEGGLGHYVSRLGEELGGVVHTGAKVERLSRDAAGWSLQVNERGSSAELRADAVVLTTPGDVQARLLAPLDPTLADLAGGIPYAPIAVAHLAWPREKVAHPLDGFGFLIPPHEGKRILGAIFVSTIFPWRAPAGQALFTVMVGGAIHPELPLLPESEIAAIAREELAPMIGATGAPSLSEVVRWERAIPQYVVGHAARLAEAEGRVAQIPGLHVGGNGWRGVGFNDCVADASRLTDRILHGR